MKIGELFIALGFDVKGKKDFDDVEKGLQSAALSAGKATVAVNAINAALLAMLEISSRAGMALRNFAITTGLSTDALQMWQHSAAVNGISADELTGSIKRLQDAQAAFAFGEPQAVGAWSLLGVNPLGDPFAVINNLRNALAGVQPMIARGLLARVGLENLAPLIQAPKSDFEQWSKNFIVSRDQIDRLARLNAAWESLKRSLVAVRNLAAASLAPAFASLARGLEWITSKIAAFVDWLNHGGIVATVVRGILLTLVAGLLVAGVVLAGITALIGALALAMAALSPALLAVLPALAGILLYGGAIAAVLAGLVLIVDDIITSLSGGNAVTRTIGEWLAGFSLIRDVIQGLWNTWDDGVKHFKEGSEIFRKLFQHLPNWALGVTTTPSAVDNLGERMAHAEMTRVVNSMRQDNNVQIHVNGSGSPEATGRAVGRSVKAELAGAAYQAPVPNY